MQYLLLFTVLIIDNCDLCCDIVISIAVLTKKRLCLPAYL